MPNKDGFVTGGRSIRGFNDNTPLSTRQVSDFVQLDEDILRSRGGRHVQDDSHEIEDLENQHTTPQRYCTIGHMLRSI